ncbi:hypothetical protein HZH66_015344 [Vespula vulgaris]|uniref:Uncharacterized protein n=1 Tax=Vespula vulgaris TaxID=7454 RepID=A0A834MLI2_VESVU|nr:hypothetical protein HZH66_015344 [Vespula vulgaris]
MLSRGGSIGSKAGVAVAGGGGGGGGGGATAAAADVGGGGGGGGGGSSADAGGSRAKRKITKRRRKRMLCPRDLDHVDALTCAEERRARLGMVAKQRNAFGKSIASRNIQGSTIDEHNGAF